MKAVADHLGVSVQGLYHHVRNRRELLVLAAERSISRLPAPEDRGQHWDEWLREWARHVYLSFVEEPEVLSQYLSGALRWESMVVRRRLRDPGVGPGWFRPASKPWTPSTRWPGTRSGPRPMSCGIVGQRRRDARRLVELHRMVATRPPEELAGRACTAGRLPRFTGDRASKTSSPRCSSGSRRGGTRTGVRSWRGPHRACRPRNPAHPRLGGGTLTA